MFLGVDLALMFPTVPDPIAGVGLAGCSAAALVPPAMQGAAETAGLRPETRLATVN